MEAYTGTQRARSTAAPLAPSFDEVVLPHLDAAYRLACWRLRNTHDAEDVVQEAALRAFRYFRTFTGGNGRAWFLRIVRNACWNRRGRSPLTAADAFDERVHTGERSAFDPESLALHTDHAALLERAMRALPARARELLVLRELEGLSYRELADAMTMPLGSVMSGLSRARHALRGALTDELHRPGPSTRRASREQEASEARV